MAILGAVQVALAQPHRGGTLRLGAYQAAGTIDPQINYETEYWQVYFVTQDQLVTFAKAEGDAGTQLVPDLAEAMPQIRAGGTEYLFRLRRGVRFSTGAEMRASDVVASFRRMFRVLGPNTGSWYAGIVGADACLKQAAGCMLTGGIEGDDAAGTVIIRLKAPDAEFLQKIALPFGSILPAGTPDHDLGTTPPAATGPYMIAEYTPVRGMVLTRNPYFHQWSEAAQPDGYVDRIEYRYGLQNEGEVTAVENGTQDWMFDPQPLDRLVEIGAEHAGLAHINPLLAYYYLEMNTRLAPFDDVRVRRAVAMAINRDVLIKLYGGPALGSPLCQLLPQGIAGFVAYCPFTKGGGDRWHAPDLARAQALVRQSGTAGMKVTLIVGDREVERSMGVYLQSVLSDLGFAASLHSVSLNIRDTYMQNTNNHVQIGLTDWYMDYPAASDFLNVLLSCASFHPGSDASVNMSGFCDPRIDARMGGAMAQELSDPAGAAAAWGEIDRALTDQAGITTLFQLHELNLVSARLGGFVFSPLFHMIFSKVWVQ